MSPWWFQAVALALNVVQSVALAYITARWRRVNGQFNDLQALWKSSTEEARDARVSAPAVAPPDAR